MKYYRQKEYEIICIWTFYVNPKTPNMGKVV